MREQRIKSILITSPFNIGEVRFFEPEEVLVAETDKNLITGSYRPMVKENAVLIFVTPEDRENYPELDYGELHEATCRWFVDKCGFFHSLICMH